MDTLQKIIAGLIICLIFSPMVSAIPANGASSAIGNNNFTLSATGVSTTGWFRYGESQNFMMWKTINQTPSGGNLVWTERGSPITPSTFYYWTACDITGCDPTPKTFTTLSKTLLPVSTMGIAMQNMTESKFNIGYLPNNILTPYIALFPTSTDTGRTVVYAIIFMFLYIGIWLRTRSVAPVVIVGILTSSFILYNETGLRLGLPPEFQLAAQSLLYVSLAAIFLTFIKK